jgi:hypothetical protein
MRASTLYPFLFLMTPGCTVDPSPPGASGDPTSYPQSSGELPGTTGMDSIPALRNPKLPTTLAVQGANPNPVREATWIIFDLPRLTLVIIEIFDLKGRLRRELFRETLVAGTHRIPWDRADNQGQRVAAGVYFCRARTGQAIATQGLVLLP